MRVVLIYWVLAAIALLIIAILALIEAYKTEQIIKKHNENTRI